MKSDSIIFVNNEEFWKDEDIDSMKIKKVLFTSVAAVAFMSVGTEMIQQNALSEVVQAAKKTSKKTLKKNAAIYNSKGKRVGKKTLKKGKKVKILGSKTIKGKKYYKIGKNKYVKQANFKATKKTSKKSSPTYKKLFGKKTNDPKIEELRNELLKHIYGKNVVMLEAKHDVRVTDDDEDIMDGSEPDTFVTDKAGEEEELIKPDIHKENGEYYFYSKDDIEINDGAFDPEYLFSVNDYKISNYNEDKDTTLKSLNKKVNKLENDNDEVTVTPKNGSATRYDDDTTPKKKKLNKPVIAVVEALRGKDKKYYYRVTVDDEDVEPYLVRVDSVTLSSAKD